MDRPDGLIGDLHQLARANLDVVELAEKVRQAIGRRVAFDYCGMAIMDPATLLPTRKLMDPALPEERVRECFDRTFAQGSCLRETTEGQQRDVRHPEVLLPYWLGDELMLWLAVDGRTWGAIKIQRRAGEPKFDDTEVALLAQAAAPLAKALRRTFLARPLRAGAQLDSPAVIVLSRDGRVVSCTDRARELLAAMADGVGLGPDRLPIVVHALACFARRPNGTALRARLLTQDGRWITVRGAALDREERVAIVMEPSSPGEVTALLLDAYGLTPRENQIARHVIHAFSTEDVADRLGISPYTVQDHLKSIFDKMGLSSRRELAARLYLRHYAPAVDGDGSGEPQARAYSSS